MNKKKRNILFVAFAGAALLAAVYHIKEIFYPTETTPAWRHALFICINIICIYGMLKRPVWFTWFIGLLTLQQWYSHGSYAIKLWQQEHQIHWISIVDIILLPLLLTYSPTLTVSMFSIPGSLIGHSGNEGLSSVST